MRLRAPRTYRRGRLGAPDPTPQQADGQDVADDGPRDTRGDASIPQQRGAGPGTAGAEPTVEESGDPGFRSRRARRRDRRQARRQAGRGGAAGPRRPGRLVVDFGRHAWGVVHAGALAVALLGVLVLALVLVAQHTPLLGVRQVQVMGSSEVAAATVRKASGVTLGTPMTAVNTDEVEARVREIPGLESATVQRVWPTTVRIDVVERVPVLAVETAAGVVLVDPEGVPFDRIVEPPETVVLFSPPERDAEEATAAAASAVAALPRAVRAEVERVSAASARDVRLQLAGGREVVWGDAQDAVRKAAVLRALLGVEGRVYDVSVPDVPVVL